jgi:hypothetical protein
LIGFAGFMFVFIGLLLTKSLSALGFAFLFWPLIYIISSFFLINIIYPERMYYSDYKNTMREKVRATIFSFGAIFLAFSSILALFSKKIFWRGLLYHQKDPFKTVVIKN